jgi:multiple sugar transport system substrate-binding protein
MQPTPTKRTVLRAACALAAMVLLTAGCASSGEKPRESVSASPAGPARITFAVYGAEPVLAAYSALAQEFNASHPDVGVSVQKYATHDAAMQAVESARLADRTPDLFLMDHEDLAALTQEKAVRRVDDLLGERRVDFGDGYGRNGLEAFSADSALQCMPADTSPLVVYYNTALIDLSVVAEPGRNAVNQADGWSLDEFAAAARQARGPGVKGLYIAPTIDQVAPFIWSGGGEVVDDLDDPTTLQLSDGSSEAAMEKLLEVVRDPTLTFNQRALERRSALQRFEDGKLGIILGHRDLTPVLRQHPDLAFDVMPMPRLSSKATTAAFQGLCISSASKHAGATADFLTYLVSDKSAAQLAATGYAMPTNLAVLQGDTFRETGQQPLNSEVFVNQIRNARPLPDTTTWRAVEAAAGLALTDLFYLPVIDPLADRLKQVDAASMPIFDPKLAGTESPSPSPGGSPSGSPSSTP